MSVVRDDSIWAQGVSADTNPYSKRGAMVRFAYFLVACVAAVLGRLGVRRPSTVVICYHAITNKQRVRFAWQMDQVARLGALSAEHVGSAGAVGVCVTFDDAFECLRANALPILRDRAIPAIIFAVSGNLGDTPRWDMPPGHPEATERAMTAEALREISEQPGVWIGSHTVSHARLTALDELALAYEMEASRRELSEITGRPIVDLAFPFGDGAQRELSVAVSTGYRRVFSLDEEVVPSGSRRVPIGRFIVSPDMSRMEFKLTIIGAYAWLGPWRRFVRWLRARLVWREAPKRSAAKAYSTGRVL